MRTQYIQNGHILQHIIRPIFCKNLPLIYEWVQVDCILNSNWWKGITIQKKNKNMVGDGVLEIDNNSNSEVGFSTPECHC